MNKYITTGLLLCLWSKAAVFAAPAYPHPVTLTQPDGSQITVMGHGDEYRHFATTTDGYTVVMAADGFYHYAQLVDGKLEATGVRASNVEHRAASETAFVKNLSKGIRPEMTESARKLGIRNERSLASSRLHAQKGAPLRNAGEQPYRGLVILVNYSDCKFSRGDEATHELYTQMMNDKGFTGYADPLLGTYEPCTGSVRDYFCDNSYGKFDPEFDVVGPIDIPRSQYYVNQVENTYELVEMVLAAADPLVDYSRYDSDGDGDVDMFYIIYAGYTSSYEGNDSRLLWPHAADLIDESGEVPDVIYDGVRLGRFACSTELYGWKRQNDRQIDGIGVICHEFSHVLGFQDHYDVQGYQEDPNTWDIMAAGSYNGQYNRTPCAYNSYEKAVAGFIEPLDISAFDGQKVTLRSTETAEDACIIHSLEPRVSFFMENRQPDKWDIPLIGHGMLVWRVDSVYSEPWDLNMVNVSERACFRLVRSNGTQGNMMIGVIDEPYDPFPGTGNVNHLDNEPGLANLLSYDRIASPVVLTEITENPETGEVSFMVDLDPLSDNEPVTYILPKRLSAYAEQLVGDTWEPVSWTVTTSIEETNGVEYYYLKNLLPGETTKIRYHYDLSGTSFGIDGQRVALNEEYGLWLCNLSSVDAGGSGYIQMNISRHGIPSLSDPDAEIGYYKLQPNAFVLSQSKLIERAESFRNLVFCPYGQRPEAIEQVINDTPAVINDGIFNLHGQRIGEGHSGLQIRNGRLIMVK